MTTRESITMHVKFERVDGSGSKFRYKFTTASAPPEVTEDFAAFLRREPGFDPAVDAGCDVVPGLSDLSDESRRDR